MSACDLIVRDGLVLVPLVVAILAFGLYPQLGAASRGEAGGQGDASSAVAAR